MHVVIIIPL